MNNLTLNAKYFYISGAIWEMDNNNIIYDYDKCFAPTPTTPPTIQPTTQPTLPHPSIPLLNTLFFFFYLLVSFIFILLQLTIRL